MSVARAIVVICEEKRKAGEIPTQKFDIRDLKAFFERKSPLNPGDEQEILECLKDLDAARLVTISTHKKGENGEIIHHYLQTSNFVLSGWRWEIVKTNYRRRKT
jgi:hypothetical protein